MANEKNSVEKAIKALEKTLTEQYRSTQGIERGGETIRIPEYITVQSAIKALTEFDKKAEEETERVVTVPGIPTDALVAVKRALDKKFGQVFGATEEVDSFFGALKFPPVKISVPTGFNTSESVPVGELCVPGLPVKINVKIPRGWDKVDMKYNGPAVMVEFSFKRLYEPLVDGIEQAIMAEVNSTSIYRTHAIDTEYKFIDVSGFDINRVVHGIEAHDLDAMLFSVIRDSRLLGLNGVPLKRTILMHGRYGTGKTMTALMTAKLCEQHGWTFVNVRPGFPIADALRAAQRLQPAVVFAEDIDAQVGGEQRTEDMNTILDRVDGILSKDANVIVVLTTNHPERINSGMLRPGRIDLVVEMGVLDKASTAKLVSTYAPNIIGDLNPDAIWTDSDGYTPAFVVEAVHRARMYAIANGNTDDKGIAIVTCDDICRSLRGLRTQYNMMTGAMESHAQTPSEKISDGLQTVIGDAIQGATEPIVELLNEVKRKVS